MSAEEKIVQRIFATGSSGIKRSDLRKEFEGIEIDKTLEKTVTHGDVVVDKKGAAYYCWHKDYYFQNLLNSDIKFRLTYEAIKSLEQSVNKASDGLARTIEIIGNNVTTLSKTVIGKDQPKAVQEDSSDRLKAIKFDEFRKEFDIAVANYSNSIGWVELAKIRNDLCNTYDLSNEEFYHLVEQLTDKYQENYELSTGGYEGVIVRGLLHGFVRSI
jgi:uncharacterized protein with HEPN domain